jgi:hypothetical protein
MISLLHLNKERLRNKKNTWLIQQNAQVKVETHEDLPTI